MTCTPCECTGFLNLHQVDEAMLKAFDDSGDSDVILRWMAANSNHDVIICDCCGNQNEWYGTRGEHDPKDFGDHGPYSYNGGLPECY